MKDYLRPIKFDIRTNRTEVVPKDPKTKIGYNSQGNFESTVTAEEGAFAETVLKDEPPGTKLYCYDYEPIDYPNPFHPTKTIRLTHSFVIVQKILSTRTIREVVPISNGAKGAHLKPESTEYKEIPQEHLAFAKQFLQTKPPHTKLHAYRKVYKDNLMRHCFMIFPLIIEGLPTTTHIVLGIAGNGWHMSGGCAKIKAVENSQALKLPTKRFLSHYPEQVHSEITLSTAIGLFKTSVKKSNSEQCASLMSLYQMDFFTYVIKLKSEYQVISHTKTTTEIETFKREKMSEYLIILIKNMHALRLYHDNNILHRDIKPENILLSIYKEGIDSTPADFGFAVKTEGGQHNSTETVGTASYLAPELNPRLNRAPFCFSTQSDIFAMGKVINKTNDHLFQHTELKNIALFTLQTNPKGRPHLIYLELSLLILLSKISGIDLETILITHDFDLKNARIATLLHALFCMTMSQQKNLPTAFFKYCKMLEQKIKMREPNAIAILSALETNPQIPMEYLGELLWLDNNANRLGLNNGFSEFLETLRDNPHEKIKKLENILWLCDSRKNNLRLLSDNNRQLSILSLWNASFWSQLEIYIDFHKTSVDQSTQKKYENEIIRLLENVLILAPDSFYEAGKPGALSL